MNTKSVIQPKVGQSGDSLDGIVGQFSEYQPEMWTVEKDTIYAARNAVEAGLEYARECLAQHESILGRTTYKNKSWAETMEDDIRRMECALDDLRKLPNSELCHGSGPLAGAAGSADKQ